MVAGADGGGGRVVAVGGDEMILVDSGARTINLGGPGAVEITMKGGMTIDATVTITIKV